MKEVCFDGSDLENMVLSLRFVQPLVALTEVMVNLGPPCVVLQLSLLGLASQYAPFEELCAFSPPPPPP